MKFLILLAALAVPAAAEDIWVLETGPSAVDTVPLKPIQPVDAWRGLYADGREGVWVYVTASPHFFAPAAPEVRRLEGTRWTIAAFFPEAWQSPRRKGWLDAWQVEFLSLSTFRNPGWPIVFPSVLKLPTLTKG
jgi:hypothetical protein